MIFEFGKATEITSYVEDKFPYVYPKGVYTKVYIIPDVHCYHIHRIMEGYGQDYEENPNKVILEYQRLDRRRYEELVSKDDLYRVMGQDDGSNWSYDVYSSVDAARGCVSQGWDSMIVYEESESKKVAD